MSPIHHAIGLSMHQPPGNLLTLHNSAERHEAKQILWCYDRVTRMLEGYEDVARLHLMFSGTLLKQLEDPAIAETFSDTLDLEDMLARYQRCQNIEYLGSGLYHPVFPLIPEADWLAQAGWWHGLGKKLLGRDWFPGFCPPEIAFSPEMIPTLAGLGYRYVIVDCWYLKPKGEMRWEELRYRPHVARHGGAEIIVVPLDRELSNAQSSGTSPWWIEKEIAERTKFCDFPALVTTWSDGENGGWFRNYNQHSNFWFSYYQPFLEKVRKEEYPVKPIFLTEYLERFGTLGEVKVNTAAWNTGDHSGLDFLQWTGSDAQKEALARVAEISQALQSAFDNAYHKSVKDPEGLRKELAEAQWHLLRAQTSCNFYWGEAWIYKCHNDLDAACTHLEACGKYYK